MGLKQFKYKKTLAKWAAATGAALPFSAQLALAQDLGLETATSINAIFASLNPLAIVTAGTLMMSVGAITYAVRAMKREQTATVDWSKKLAEMEARLDKSESVLAAHPGLVLVWNDSYADIDDGWGNPKILGGPAALASILTFADDAAAALDNPAASLLNRLGQLPLEEEVAPEDVRKLKDRIQELRSHGVTFSGSIVTDEGRSIDVDGRVAGDQVTLWLTDPAVRLAEDGGLIGKARDRAADLHGALNHLDRLPMATWRRGPDLKIEWANNAYVAMVEAINLQEVIENQIEVDPTFKKLAQKAKDEFGRSGGRRILDDIVVVNIRGVRRVFRIMEQAMHSAGDAGLGGIAIDITKLDKAQEDLKRHQNAYRKTLDQVPSAVAVFGGTQQLDYYNASFLDLWKLDDGDLRVRPYHGELFDRLHQNNQLPAVSDYRRWKEDQLKLYTDPTEDGAAPDDIWSLPNGKTLRVVRQRHPLGGLVMLFEDITENLRLETQFNTQISVQRATLNNLAEGVAVFASDGKLRLFNRAFQQMWQFDPARLTEQPDFELMISQFGQLSEGSAKAWQNLKGRITSFAAEDRVPIDHAEVTLKDGRTFAYATAPLPDGATLLTFLDVTDSREREKELQERNEWLETADRIKTKFVNHISYNLRNPLNTIIGFAEMLETEMFGTLNDRQKDYAASILSASNHLLDLINDIIDLAAIDAGKLDLEVAEMDVRKTLQNAATYAALKAEDSAITLKLDIADDVGDIRADEKRIKQVLFNLLANAFSFTDEGGKVTLGAERDGNTIRIWVQDTGRGVSSEDQAKAFDRFESRGPGAGAGLGLSLVKSFVELHGGWVRLSSREGQGTHISCHLPANGPDKSLSGLPLIENETAQQPKTTDEDSPPVAAE